MSAKETIKTILIDDERDSREVLANLIGRHFPEIKIIGDAGDIESGYQLVKRLHPQLVFLDIQMPLGDGFSLLKKFETVPFKVIFVTSFDQYAINAIKFSALDYLLKPVEVVDLREAINKAIKSIEQKTNNAPLVLNLLHNLGIDDYEKTLTVHTGEKVLIITVRDVEFIEGDGRYSNLYIIDKNMYMVSRSLKEFEDYLGEHTPFIRISKSYLVNASHIVAYGKGEPCIIEMKSGKTFEVARRKKQDILETLKMIRQNR